KAVGGNSVKSCQESLRLPRIISMISTENRGKQAKSAIIQVAKLRMPLIRDRRSQSDRSKFGGTASADAAGATCVWLICLTPFLAGQGNNGLPHYIHDQSDNEEDHRGIHQCLSFNGAGFGKVQGQQGCQGIGG